MDEQQQRRDSQLFQGVSEGLERLNITEPTEAQGMSCSTYLDLSNISLWLGIPITNEKSDNSLNGKLSSYYLCSKFVDTEYVICRLADTRCGADTST